MPVSGGDAQPVTVRSGVAAAPAPDGGLYIIRAEERGVWHLRPGDDGVPRDVGATRLSINLSPADWANWEVDGGFIYTLERRFDGAATVFRYDPETGGRVEVASVRDVPEGSGLAVFPGGRRVLLARQERTDSDIYLAPDF